MVMVVVIIPVSIYQEVISVVVMLVLIQKTMESTAQVINLVKETNIISH